MYPGNTSDITSETPVVRNALIIKDNDIYVKPTKTKKIELDIDIEEQLEKNTYKLPENDYATGDLSIPLKNVSPVKVNSQKKTVEQSSL